MSEYDEYMATRMASKNALAKGEYEKLERYLSSSSNDQRSSTTFKYVDLFFRTGEVHDRIIIACGDFGYTYAELITAKSHGKTSADIGQEILQRGYRVFRGAGKWDVVPYVSSS